MAKVKRLYVVVFGEANEGHSPIAIQEDLAEAKALVEFKRESSSDCDETYIEVWESAVRKPPLQAVPGSYDHVGNIPEDPLGKDNDQVRGQR